MTTLLRIQEILKGDYHLAIYQDIHLDCTKIEVWHKKAVLKAVVAVSRHQQVKYMELHKSTDSLFIYHIEELVQQIEKRLKSPTRPTAAVDFTVAGGETLTEQTPPPKLKSNVTNEGITTETWQQSTKKLGKS